MSAMMSNGPACAAWDSVEACTLPTVERPRRLAEFNDLFATALETIENIEPTHARFLLAGDEAVAERTRRLADAETSCCWFFTFGVSALEPGLTAVDVEVPEAYADVLAALVARAKAAIGAAS